MADDFELEEANNPAEDVDIEAIMQQIREQILAQRASLAPQKTPSLRVSGDRFPPAFYEHLYQAGLAYDQLQVQVFVSKSSLPIIGPTLQWLRGKLHELVIYYVNQSAAQQIAVNTHLLQALSVLAETLEEEADKA
jgi:hypothetical protein